MRLIYLLPVKHIIGCHLNEKISKSINNLNVCLKYRLTRQNNII